MTDLINKLNFKDQRSVVVLNAPAEFADTVKEFSGLAKVHTSVLKVESGDFAIVFAKTQAEVDTAARALASKLEGDVILWMCYPKGSSKRYTCDLDRDTGWTVLGELGFEPVRQIAIDEDWSALRFRRVEYIKNMTRSFAMTEAGKKKVSGNR